jgi:hypothetical protein
MESSDVRNLSIELEFGTEDSVDRELIPEIPEAFLATSGTGDIQLSGLVAYLK